MSNSSSFDRVFLFTKVPIFSWAFTAYVDLQYFLWQDVLVLFIVLQLQTYRSYKKIWIMLWCIWIVVMGQLIIIAFCLKNQSNWVICQLVWLRANNLYATCGNVAGNAITSNGPIDRTSRYAFSTFFFHPTHYNSHFSLSHTLVVKYLPFLSQSVILKQYTRQVYRIWQRKIGTIRPW